MRLTDVIRFALASVGSARLRSSLTALGIAIGVAAVVLLTSMGEGLHRFVLEEFTAFGTNLVGINPGRTTTYGGSLGVFGTTRPLTLDDSEALKRLPHVTSSVAISSGNASVEGNGRERRTTVYGTGPEFPTVFSFEVALGEFLPPDDPRAPRALAVLGSTVREELFGTANPLGERIRVGGDRYRVVGVMAEKGNMMGFDLDDTVYIPAARSLELFNREGVMEIDVLYRAGAPVDEVVAGVTRILVARHGGEDFTITTQEQMMDVLGSVLGVVTLAVSALGGISLLVGGVGIFTIMTIAVRDRTPEIGLLRAVGAPTSQIHALFLGEAVLLSALGGVAGLVAGAGIALLVDLLVPALPVHISLPYVLVAEVVAIAIGLVAGVVPAHRAAGLDPLAALASE